MKHFLEEGGRGLLAIAVGRVKGRIAAAPTGIDTITTAAND
jgi:hypothetical protein